MFTVVTWVAAIVWVATGHLSIMSSRHDLINPKDPAQVRLREFNERFGSANDLIVVLEGSNPSQLRATADAVAARFRKEKSVGEVFYKVDLELLADNGLYYLPLADLKRVQANLDRVEPIIAKRRGRDKGPIALHGIVQAIENVNKAIDALGEGETGGLSDMALDGKDLDDAADVLVAMAGEIREWLEDPQRASFSFRARFGGKRKGLNLDASGYLVAGDGQLLLMRISSLQDIIDDVYARPLVREVRAILAEVVPDSVTWSVTGVPAMVVEEQDAIKADVPLTSVVSTAACLLIFLIAYKSLWSTLAVFLPLVVGFGWALGLTALTVGHLNLLTSSMIVILIGMGIDFGVHLLTRVREERKLGVDSATATRVAMTGTGPAVITGALTSAAAFAAMLVTDFRALRELGMIGALGLLAVLAATFVVLPFLLGRAGTRFAAPRASTVGKPKVFRFPARAGLPILIAGAAITAVLAWEIKPIEFNFDVGVLLPEGSPSKLALERLEKKGVGGFEFAVLQAHSVAEARREMKALTKLQSSGRSVERIESIFDVLPPDLEAKEPIIAQLRARVAKLPDVTFSPDEHLEEGRFVKALETLSENLSNWLPVTLTELGRKELNPRVARVAAAVSTLLAAAKALPPADVTTRLLRFESRIASLADRVVGFFKKPHAPLQLEELPPSLTSPFYRVRDGKPYFAIRVYPHGDVSDPALMRQFASDLYAIDSEATGYAINYTYFADLMHRGFRVAALWAAVLVVLLVLLDLRGIRDTLIALVPLGMGGIWMIGLINVLGVGYNFANVVAIPLIIGIGIDSGVHVVHRWRECGDVSETLRSTGRAVLVSSLTTCAAFGSLVLARHGGASSLGLTLLLGVSACMVISLVFLPALLLLFRPSRPIPPVEPKTE